MSEVLAPKEYIPEYEDLSNWELTATMLEFAVMQQQEDLSDEQVSRSLAVIAVAARRFMLEHMHDEKEDSSSCDDRSCEDCSYRSSGWCEACNSDEEEKCIDNP